MERHTRRLRCQTGWNVCAIIDSRTNMAERKLIKNAKPSGQPVPLTNDAHTSGLELNRGRSFVAAGSAIIAATQRRV